MCIRDRLKIDPDLIVPDKTKTLREGAVKASGWKMCIRDSYSFFHPLVIVPLAAGILSLVFFVRRQLRIANPLLDVRIFKNRDFAVGTTLISDVYKRQPTPVEEIEW